MKRFYLFLACAAPLVLTPLGHGGPVTPVTPQNDNLPPLVSRTYTVECKAGDRTCAIAIGSGATPLGMYVYDAQGNCIGWDDAVPNAHDDLLVDWFPAEKAFYTIEVRNCGLQVNEKCKIIVR